MSIATLLTASMALAFCAILSSGLSERTAYAFSLEQVALIPHPGPGPHAHPTPVTALAFDTSQELLWTGNEYVRHILRRELVGEC
jgi:hypothetical protein